MLKGKAKKIYQRKYMRDYMRKRRGVKTHPVKTPQDIVKTPVVTPNAKALVKTPFRPIAPLRPSKNQLDEWAKFKRSQRG